MLARWPILLVFLLACGGNRAQALQPEEIVLIANSAVPEGRRLADFYVQARRLPQGRICEVNVPAAEHLSFQQYETELHAQVVAFLIKERLMGRAKCLVPMFGVPLRIDAKKNTAEENAEREALLAEHNRMMDRLRPQVAQLEEAARRTNPRFAGGGGDDPLALLARATAALREMRSVPPALESTVLELFGINATASTRPAEQGELRQLHADIARLLLRRFDAESRRSLRVAIARMGTLHRARVLREQAEYLTPQESGAAVDSELALIQVGTYPRARWLDNPLHFAAPEARRGMGMMVCRLDGPTPNVVEKLIVTSLRVEREGLSGSVVVDLWAKNDKPDQRGSYGWFDRSLRRFAEEARRIPNLAVVLDEKPELLPAGSQKSVALYCGWYSVRNYVACCEFVPGAVGYHTASYELVSLRGPNETGWVANLLKDGVVATVGPVEEPYLHSFPPPDEFFPLLMTGKLPLAEVYWLVTPTVSWNMVLIGDPLYRPFAQRPLLDPASLPPGLREAVGRAAATRPAGR